MKVILTIPAAALCYALCVAAADGLPVFAVSEVSPLSAAEHGIGVTYMGNVL